MLRVYEYECPEHGRTEVFQKAPQEHSPCPTCGQQAERRISATRSKLEGISGAFPTAADKWARVHYAEARRDVS